MNPTPLVNRRSYQCAPFIAVFPVLYWMRAQAMYVVAIALELPAYVHTRLGGACENRGDHLAARYR
jgi:hypothetical protein